MKQRVISAVVLLTISLTCIFVSFVTRVLFFGVVGILCAYEYSRGLEKINVYCAAWVMYVYIAVQAVLALTHAGAVSYIACFTGGIYLAMFSGIVHRKVSGQGAIYTKVSGQGAIYTVAGLAYPGVIYGVMMMISVGSIWDESLILGAISCWVCDSFALFGLGAISCWVCDSFALFGGLRFGKHKLAPNVSPNKSIEGSVCGALASMVAGLVIWALPILPRLSLPVCLVTALVSSSVGQIGDLAESMIKRMLGLKDFSNLIPGHGGMFDRTDSLMFAIPTAYLCLHIAGIGV